MFISIEPSPHAGGNTKPLPKNDGTIEDAVKETDLLLSKTLSCP